VAGVSEAHRFAGVVLVDRRGWLLLQERDEHPAIDPEKWGLVGGHLDPGEEFEPAAYRELAEETEIVIPPGGLRLWKVFDVDHTEAYGTIDRMAVYVAGVDLTDADVVCHEGRRIVFVEPASVLGLPLTKAGEVIMPELLGSDLYKELLPH
jgi:8-oxo-dGTP pyrophosphatase MutT (NUDIX family)